MELDEYRTRVMMDAASFTSEDVARSEPPYCVVLVFDYPGIRSSQPLVC